MGCNCGKKRPTGMSPSKRDQRAASYPIPATKKASGQRQSFRLTTTDGKTQTFGSRLEASAARVRAGGGTIRPV